MSVLGIAREAAAILPRFGIPARLKNDPYSQISVNIGPSVGTRLKKINIKSDPLLNPRWISVIIDNITVKSSPSWMRQKHFNPLQYPSGKIFLRIDL